MKVGVVNINASTSKVFNEDDKTSMFNGIRGMSNADGVNIIEITKQEVNEVKY